MFAFLWRVLVRATSAIALVALAAGIPAGLAAYIGWPLPDHMPSLAELRGFATTGVTDQVVLNTLAVVLWLVWLLIVVSVVVEAAAAVRGVQAPRLRLLGPVQSVAATLIAGLTFGVVAATAGPVSAGLLSPPAAQTAPAVPAAASLVLAASPEHPIVLTAAHTTTAAPAGKVTLVIGDCGYEHKVVKGESLWRIAQLCLGDPHRWPEIYKLNKGKYWPHVSGHTTLHNPNLIFPGWVLELPHDAVPPPGGQPVTPPITPTPPAHATPSASPTVTPPASPVTPSPSITAVTPASTGPAIIAVPSGSASTSATPGPSPTATVSHTPSATPDDPTDDPASGEQPAGAGIHIPGGWIPAILGAALLAAAGRVWLRRRHRYTATPITTPVLDDADLTPPLAASTRIRQALRRAHPDTPDEPVQVPTVREYNAAEVKPALPPVGPSGADLAGAGTLPLSAGLGVTGPGAHDAARAMLVAVLSSGTLDDPDAQGRAIIPATTLATLLAVSAVELGPIPRLTIAASMAEAMTILEEEIIRRSRIIAEQEVADVAALRAANAYAEPLPQLLLIADTPDPVWQKRLATAIGLGETVDIGAVLLGVWPHGATLTVAGDGTTTGGDGQRLAVLDTDAAAQALTMLHEAYADQPLTPPAGTVASSAPSRSLADDLLDPEPGTEEAARDQPAATGADAAGRRVQVRVLGVPAVLDATGQPVQKLRAKSIELLVYLAVNRAGAPLAQIMEALWPDATWRRASERLSTCVANLRHAIRGVLSDANPDDATDYKRVEPVLNSGSHYRIDPAVVDVDWWTVLDNYAHVAHSDDDAARLAHLKNAIDAIGGGLAAGADYEWADTDREHARRHQIKIYVHAAGIVADDDPHQSRVLLDTACEIDPLSEDLAQRAMRAAAALGDADAIRHRLRILRQALDDSGIDIAPATEQLAKDLLRDLTRQNRTDT